MKKMILLLSLILTMKAMAVTDQYDGNTQSYIIHDTGEVSTIKTYFKAGTDGQFILPDVFLHTKVNLKVAKGNYFIDEWDVITTVNRDGNRDGFSFTLDQVKYDGEDIDIYGHSYWINDDGSLHIVRNDGSISSIKEPFKKQDVDLNDVKIAGGTFMITDNNKLIIVDPSGRATNKSKFFKYKWEQVKRWGHNWYQTHDGKIYTIGFKQLFVKNDDGTDSDQLLYVDGNRMYYSALYIQKETYKIARKGGNYFFDKNRNLHTVSTDGILNMKEANRKFKVQDEDGKNRPFPEYYGINYFIYSDGTVFQIGNTGYMWFLGKQLRRTSRSNMYKTKTKK